MIDSCQDELTVTDHQSDRWCVSGRSSSLCVCLTGVHSPAAGGGAETPGDPAAAAATRAGHATGERERERDVLHRCHDHLTQRVSHRLLTHSCALKELLHKDTIN